MKGNNKIRAEINKMENEKNIREKIKPELFSSKKSTKLTNHL